MKPTVLIISCSKDIHVEAVLPHLRSHDVQAHLFVPDLLLSTQLTLDPVNRKGKIHTGEGVVDVESVGAVWLRKPEPVTVSQFSPHLSGDELDFIQAEGQETVDGLYALLADRYWLTNPPAFRLAARKMLQLAVAKEAGFVVPRSIVTSEVDQATDFAASVGWDIAIKSLSWAAAHRNDGPAMIQYGVYCRRLTKAEAQAGLNHVRFSPTLLQEYIPKLYDLRVVAVGHEKLFPVQIDSQGNPYSAEDCRLHIRDLPHRLVEAPQLEEPIRRYMHKMGLQFACFDFAVSSVTGQPVFLEANVNGQWLWLERQAGAPISKAIAQVLAEHATSHIPRRLCHSNVPQTATTSGVP